MASLIGAPVPVGAEEPTCSPASELVPLGQTLIEL